MAARGGHPALEWIDLARFLAGAAVVVLHAASVYVTSPDAVSPASWWWANVVDAGVRWCVPLFVMISGALLLTPQTDEQVVDFYRKRMRRILLPLVFWALTYVLLRNAAAIADGRVNWVQDVLLPVMTGRPAYHLWYLYMIAGLYAVTPFLRLWLGRMETGPCPRVGRSVPSMVVGTCAFLLAAGAAFNEDFSSKTAGGFFPVWFLPYMGYYLFGYVAARMPPASPSVCRNLVAVFVLCWMAGVFLFGRYYPARGDMYFYSFVGVAQAPMSLALFLLLRTLNDRWKSPAWMRRLSAATFGIYLFHPLFLEIMMRVAPYKEWSAFIWIPAAALLAYIFSAAAVLVCKRFPFLRALM